MDQNDEAGDSRAGWPAPRPRLPHAGALGYLDAAWRGLAGSLSAKPPRSAPGIISDVVQDLTGPLTSFLTSTALLASDLDDLRPERRRAMESMQRQGVLLQNRSENLLCAAAIWDGSFQLRPHYMAVGEIVSEIVPVVRPVLDDRRQRLEVVTQGEEVKHCVYLDPRRVAQVVINLVLNASALSPVGSCVCIDVSPRGSNIRMSVASRGPAIPHERLPGIFELFHRPLLAAGGDDAILGLSVMRVIIEAHGGTVGARNRKGGGPRVWFELPLPNGAR